MGQKENSYLLKKINEEEEKKNALEKEISSRKINYKGENYKVQWKPEELYSCHIEYEYLGKYGDCVDLNTLTDTFYIYPENCKFSVTKLALATEELWKYSKEKNN